MADQSVTTYTFPAPVRGWIENENLAANGGTGCTVLENGFPLSSTVRIRGGYLRVANIGSAVKALIPFRSGLTTRLFATSETQMFDITSAPGFDYLTDLWPESGDIWPEDTDLWLSGTAITPSDPLFSWGGRASYVQMDTGGDTPFLVAANGTGPIIYFDGAEWNPIVSAAVNEVAYDALTGSFAAGQTVVGQTSSASATILMVQSATATTGRLLLGAITGGPYQDNENLRVGGVTQAVANGASGGASAIVWTGVATDKISHLWVHNNRLWGVEKGTMRAWFLPVDQIGGAATDFNLGGVFQDGGALLFGATWSADSGSGMGDRCVFVSTEGEIAVYEGIDPADPDAWSKVGLYNIGRPVSTQTIKSGGDLLVATTDGIVPMSAVVTKDPAALSMAAVSYPIEPAWRRVAAGSDPADNPVQLLKWQTQSMAIVGYPQADQTHVVNVQTGAWSKWTGHDIQCMALHNDQAFFGASDGYVAQMEVVGADGGHSYVFRAGLLPDSLGAPGAHKQIAQARATFRALAPFIARLSVAMDYRREFPAAPNVSPTPSTEAIWDTGTWDTAQWDNAASTETRMTRTTRWRSIGRSGFAASPQVQISSGGRRKPDAELVELTVSYQAGGVVV